MIRAVALGAALVWSLGAVSHACAGMYSFDYSDASGNQAHGTITTTSSGLGDGSQWSISGILDVTKSSDGNGSVGTYTLLSAGPGVTTSPSGLFAVDNLFYPANNAASGVNPGSISANPSYLTNWGLLFGKGSGTTGSQNEINIWGNGKGDYAFYSEANGSYNIQNSSGGTFTASAVPEPATLTLFGSGLFCLAGCAWRRRKLAKAD